MSEDHDLTIAPIPKLIAHIAWPVCIGFFFNTMFNVVDTYFGGKISTSALAAMSLSFPVFFLIIIFDSGISTGTTAVIANAVGAKEDTKKYAAQSISFGLIVSCLVTLGGLLFAPSLFRLLGASGEYLELALQYINVIFYGAIFFLMISVFNSMLQARGDTRTYRNFLIAGFFLNIILDPWLLYGGLGVPAMGLRGVALATVIIQLLGMVYIFKKTLKTGLVSKDTFKNLWPEKKAFMEIVKQAVPASLNLVTIGVGIFVITYFISQFGENAVAAYGIATRVEQISLLPTIGITIACLSIIGQNNGAKKFDRIKETLKTCLRYGLSVMAVGSVLTFIFSKLIMEFFTKDQNVVAIGAHYLKIAPFIFFAYTILFITISALQGMKKPMYAVWIGIYRQILAPVAVFWILINIFGIGIDAVWWGVFGITWSAAIITAFYAKHVMKKLPVN
ncbi:MAG TPA: MATE family efflux transporter [Candidatus Paceibacterota bacterium]